MKINNFAELDKILKNSFKKIRDETKTGDDKLSKEVGFLNKDIENSKKTIKKTEENIKNSFKSYEGQLKELKKELSELRKSQKKVISDAEKKIDSKADFINNLIDKFKKDVVSVIKLMKTKTISKEVFEKRMKNTDENTKKLSSYIKEIIVLRDNLKDIKSNKAAIIEINSKSDNLKEQVENLEPLQKEIKEIEKKVGIEEFNKEIKDIKTRLDYELKEAVTNLKEVNKIRDLEAAVSEIKKKGVSENELKELKEEEELMFKNLSNEIKIIKKEVATKASLNNEIEKLRVQLKDLKQVINDWNKKISDELKLKSESQKFMKEITTILDEKKEKKKISEKEERELDLKDMEAKPEKPAILKKAVNGIIDFFVEEEDEIREEAIKRIEEGKPKAKEKGRKPKIQVIEEEKKIETEEREETGVLTKMKEGVVNFFFEEAEEEGEEKSDIGVFKELKEEKKKPAKIEVYGGKENKDKKKEAGPKKPKTKTTGKKKYKKVDKDTFVDDFGKEKTYYPEDYFY